jgi:hypothetical protein
MSKKTRYDWITAMERPSIVDNQTPGPYVRPLFDWFVKEGWEIVSVTVLPEARVSSCDMCTAIGVLRKPK